MRRALTAFVGAAVFILAVGASAQVNGFTRQMAISFESECIAGGDTAALCTCVWSGVQERMSAADYASFVDALRSQRLHPSMGEFELIIGVCNGASRITASDPEAYPGHISANFASGCVSGGVPRTTCTCAMSRFEREWTLQQFSEIDYMHVWGRGPEHPLYGQYASVVQSCAAAPK